MGSSNKHLVIITGMHRSGTSAVSNLFRKLGFHLGDNMLGVMSQVNHDGFWEDKSIVSLNNQILHLLSADWYSFLPLPLQWWERPDMDSIEAEAEKWLKEEFDYKNPSSLKDPRFSRLLPFWSQFFHKQALDFRVVIVFRHPWSVAQSLCKRDDLPEDICYLLWLTYVIESLEYAKDENSQLICYERLIDSPEEETEFLLNKILKGIPRLKRVRFRRIVNSSINASRNHHPLPDQIEEAITSEYGRLAFDLYEKLYIGEKIDDTSAISLYKNKLQELIDNDHSLILIAQDLVNKFIRANQGLQKIGEDHSEALKMIEQKDKSIVGNKSYIKKCHTRIKDQDQILDNAGAYIKRCERRIEEQDELIRALKNDSLFWNFYYSIKQTLRKLIFR